MTRMRRRADCSPWPALLPAIALSLSACNSIEPTRSGFLEDYASLRPDPANGERLIQVAATDQDWARYRTVVIDAPRIMAPGLDAAAAADLATLLRDALRQEFGRDRGVISATEATTETLRVRVAVTRVMRPIVALNVVLTAVTGPLDNGGAAAEAEILDAASNRRLLAISHAGVGRLDVVGYYSATHHARAELRRFAATLAATTRPSGPFAAAAR
ncbi:DUF3313 domain-containing protein [Leptolyngbya sp. 15MV]|nr:DUF3313 domain-containing protein [Leptolyngbya sp. 15MV]